MSLDSLLEKGERIYLQKFRKKLESDFLGFYVVIDVDVEDFVVSENKKKAYEIAKEKFGKDKLFFGTQIGELDESVVNYRENASLSWAV